MRFLLNMLAVLLLAGLVAGGVWFLKEQQTDEQSVEATRASVRTLQRQITVQAGLGTVEVNGRGWPKTVDPAWFGGHPPMNTLVTVDRPWLEVAPPEHADLEHPPVRMTIGDDIASFWYNPGTGIVRARVPVTVSDKRATDLYNAINGTTLVSIFADQGPVEPRQGNAVPSTVAGAESEEN